MKWPVFAGNTAIKPGLAAERDATLQVYIWEAYINQDVVNSFAKKYKCKVQLTTFNTMNEALSKLRSGLTFDVLVGATPDVLGQIVEGQLAQPLSHSYIPNISQAWPDYTNPFYDLGWQYTVPYTIYTTGITWRKDLVRENPYTMKNPWAMPWQPKYRGRVAILDDYREGICLGLMKNGIFDLNTTNYQQTFTGVYCTDVKPAQSVKMPLKMMVAVGVCASERGSEVRARPRSAVCTAITRGPPLGH